MAVSLGAIGLAGAEVAAEEADGAMMTTMTHHHRITPTIPPTLTILNQDTERPKVGGRDSGLVPLAVLLLDGLLDALPTVATGALKVEGGVLAVEAAPGGTMVVKAVQGVPLETVSPARDMRVLDLEARRVDKT